MAEPRRARGNREVFDPARRATQLHHKREKEKKKEKALPNVGKGQVNPRKLPQPHNLNSRAAKSWRWKLRITYYAPSAQGKVSMAVPEGRGGD